MLRGPTDMSIYLDGVDVGGSYTGSGGALVQSSDPLVVGRRRVYDDWFKGRLDEIRLYGRELDPSEVEDLAKP